jgi:hypothetical protein
MATGLYPLRNYPGRYLNEGKVKYRSHNYQNLPDINKYPSLFCRLVKRSLSCDPVRRPTLFQITSIMKKDSRTLTMMSSNGRGKTSVVSLSSSPGSVGARQSVHRRDSAREHSEVERSGEQGTESLYGRHKHHSLTSAQPVPNLPSFSVHEQTVPSKRTKTEPRQPSSLDSFSSSHRLPSPRLREPQHWSHDSYVVPTYDSHKSRDSQVRSHDPSSHAPSQQFSQSYNGGRGCQQYSVDHGRWSDVGTSTTRFSPHVSRAMSERGAARPPPTSAPILQQRRGSLGGFSDEFSPLSRNFPSSPAHKTSSDMTQSQSSMRYSESLHSPHVHRMGRKRSSGGTSDSDGNGAKTGDTEYQRLLPDDSQEEQLTHQAETETSREPRPDKQAGVGPVDDEYRRLGPGSAHDVRQVPRRPQLKIRSYEASRRTLRRPSEQVEFRRASSLQQSSGSSTASNLPPRQCHSDSETRVGGAVSLHSSPRLPRALPSDYHSPQIFRNTPPWNSIGNNTTGREHPHTTLAMSLGEERWEREEESSRHRMEETDGDNEGGASEPMQVSPVTTHTFEISDKLSDVSTSAQVGMAIATGDTTSVSVVSDPGLVENVSLGTVEHSVSGQRERFEEVSYQHQVKMECETQARDTFGQENRSDNQLAQQQYSTAALRSDFEAAGTPSAVAPSTPQWTGEQQIASSGIDQSQHNIPRNPTVTTVYSGPHIMSPIAEVSQEFSTQQTATQTFSASQTQHTQFTQSMHSLSPLPEQRNESELRRSSSPFHHDALGNAVSTVLSPPSAVSDNTNPSITSQVARVVNRADMPQLEPPSTSSDTSHSLTRSSEVDSNQQNLYLPPSTGSADFTLFSRQNRVASTTQSSTVMSTQLLSQNLPQTSENLPERQSQSQVPPTQEPSSASFTPATAAAQSQRTQDIPEYHHQIAPPSREESQCRSLHSSGAHQSTVSDSSRERYGGWQSWSTASAPPSCFVNFHRRNRRSASPANTHAPSVLSDSVAVHFRVAQKQTSSELGDSGSHRGSGRRRHHHRGSLGSSSNGSRHHHHAAQRLSQDLEMMTRAIEGMDSGNPMEGDGSIARDEGRRLHSPSPPKSVPQTNRAVSGGAPTRLSSSSDTRLGYRAVINALSPPGHPSLAASRAGLSHTHPDFLFRHSPNPPNSLTSLSQIPPNNDSPDMSRSDCVTQNLAQSVTPLAQGGEIVHLSPVQFPASLHMEEQQREAVIPPPAPGAGSSEYLPPYSPLRQAETQTSQRDTATVVREDQPIYRDPPPSYEEIFGQHGGRRQRQRQRRPSRQSRRREDEGAAQAVGGESQSQQDPPTTHRHSRSSGHRRLSSLTSLFKRSRKHTSHDPNPTHSTSRTGRAQSSDRSPQLAPSSRQQEEVPRERSQLPVQDSPEPSTLQRTASWVASYSQTPRPITAYQQLERGFREFSGRDEVSSSVSAGGNAPHSSAHSQVSRAVSDTAAAMALRQNSISSVSHSQPTHHIHQLGLPGLPSYRHPPPFSLTSSRDPSLTPHQRLANYTLGLQNSNTQPSRDSPGHSSTQQDANSRQPGYALSPQDTTTRQPASTQDSQPVRIAGQDSSPQQLRLGPVVHTGSATQQTHHAPSPVSSQSRSLAARPHGQTLNLSLPTISLNSTSPGGRGDASSPSSPQQVPIFHRVLAHPPRTRPISPLVTSAEYSRGVSSVTSVTSPASTNPSEARAVLVSAVERLRTQQSTESLRAPSSHSQQEVSNATPRQLFLPWQLDAQANNDGGPLGANGNANNDKPPPNSSHNSPNATPKNSPVLERRVTTAGPGETESSQPLQSQIKTTENGASQDGNKMGLASNASNGGGEGKQSRKSTQRSRAASRRLAQQLSSSDEELGERSSSSSSHCRPRHRPKRGNSSSRSSSRQENKNNSLTGPDNTQAPEFFPSFQSQPTELPQDGLFSTVSSDLTAQSTITSVVSRDSHMTAHQRSHDQHHQQQRQEIVLTQVPKDASPKPQPYGGSHENTTEVSHEHPITSPAARSNERVSTPEPPQDTAVPPRQEEVRSHDPASDVTAVEVVQINNGAAGTRDQVTPVPEVPESTRHLTSSPHHSTTSTISKPCGHLCAANGDRDTCCQCVDSSHLVTQSCDICESRRSLGQVCSCAPNKPNKFCPIHRGRAGSSLPTPIDARHQPVPYSHQQHNRKHIKNCIVM